MEMTWQQVETRLRRLETQMTVINSRLNQKDDTQIEYVILVDNQEVWAGSDVDQQLPTVFKQYPHKQIQVDWRSVPFSWV
jgi:hypothetical protein